MRAIERLLRLCNWEEKKQPKEDRNPPPAPFDNHLKSPFYKEIWYGVKFATFGYKKDEIKRASKRSRNPLEASHDHLLITPSSHFCPQKIEGLVVG